MPPTDTNCAISAMHINNLGSVFPPSGVPNRVHPHKERTLASTRKLDPGAVGRRAAVGAMAGRGLGFQYMTTSFVLQEAIHTNDGHMASALRGKRVAKVNEVAWILHKDPVDSQLCTQFFAVTDEECWHAFGVEPKVGKPDEHEYDEEVVCTSYHSQFEPTENGEVHIRQVKWRKVACCRKYS